MRRLVFDGAPSTNLYGVDIVSHWDVGFAMFRDRDTFSAHFIEADFMSSNPTLQKLEGTADVIFISQVLHQWNWSDQLRAAKRLVAFSKPGTLLAGCQIGNVNAREVKFGPEKVPLWRQNPESFTKLWEQAGVETGSNWKTEAWLRTWKDMGWDPQDQALMEEDDRVIDFVVTRTQ